MLPIITRRSFVAGAVVLPFTTWLERFAGSMPAQKYVRYDATSTQGKAMLQTYATAVQRMKALQDGDPRGWTFQWYTHATPAPKAGEILRVFGLGPSTNKALAQAAWNTCQPHNSPGVEDYFLPWHRAYVLYFESIVRAISGNQQFTLPYWNYTVQGADHAVIPPEFRDTTSPLYVSNRNPGVNDGVPIDRGLDPSPINLSVLSNCYYDTSDGTPGNGGFNPDLDTGLHGSVHVLTGGPLNMGAVPWAARDPVFWAHHCQIDRLWYSWQQAGRSTPPMSYKFTFADASGNAATVDLSDFLDQNAMPYVYDAYVDVPPCTAAQTAARLGVVQEMVLAAQPRSEPVVLGATPTVVTLTPRAPQGVAATAAQQPGARLRALPRERRVFLTLRDLRTNFAPGTLYQVFLQLPASASGQAAREFHVGYVNFFEATHIPEEGGHHRAPTVRFDVTELARRLAASGAVENNITVTIRPAGSRAPEPDARPTIGEILVVHQ